jgi:hypothetical protein
MRKILEPTIPPPRAAARLFRAPDGMPEGWLIVVACSPTPAEPASLTAPGTVRSLFTHDAGVDWPDALGARCASWILASGGGVGLVFASLADALACRLRLQNGGAVDA